jgi:hypothetical protein
MHEYGWTVSYTLRLPLVQAFALYTAIAARYDNEPAGPTYREQELIDALRKAAAKP